MGASCPSSHEQFSISPQYCTFFFIFCTFHTFWYFLYILSSHDPCSISLLLYIAPLFCVSSGSRSKIGWCSCHGIAPSLFHGGLSKLVSPTNSSLSLSNYNLVVIVDCEGGDLVWSSKYISQNTTVIRGRQVVQYWKYIFYISPSMSASFETFIAHRIYHHPDLEKGGGVAHHHRNHPFPKGNKGDGGLYFPRCVFLALKNVLFG